MKTHHFHEDYQINVGRNDLLLTVEVKGCIYPEEPMVMYYPDGSGYPGCPSEVEFDHIRVVRVEGEFGVIERNASGWFDLLDGIIDKHYAEYLDEKVRDNASEY